MPLESSGNFDGHDSILPGNGAIPTDLRSSECDAMGKRNVKKRGPKRKGRYVGICYHRKNKNWVANIMVGFRRVYLGAHKSPEIAAKVYDTWARRLHGEKATLNFPKQ